MSVFRFKQFEVVQNQSAMKIGTDGVLLGAWAKHPNPHHILDVGTGTGLIALMLAQRFSHAKIASIEIEKGAFDEATYNHKNSPFSNRLSQTHIDFKKYESNQTFDLIVSNPPFFENALVSENKTRSIARHTDSLSYVELINASARLLNKQGNLTIIIPTDVETQLIQVAQTRNLFPNRILHVRGRADLPIKRSLLEFKFEEREAVVDELIIEQDRHVYTQEYIALTNKFYLKM